MDNFPSKKEKQLTIAYFLASFLAIFILSFFVLFFVEKQIRTIQFNELKTNEARLVKLENAFISKEFGMIISDLHYLKHLNGNALSGEPDYEFIANSWAEFSTHRQIYDQIRFIDLEGNEVVRINYINGEGQIVPQAQLQNKKDRPYFQETILLDEESIYVSALDLNMEHGAIEVPNKPILRFAIPVYDKANHVNGIVVLNYLADDALRSFKRLAQSSMGEMVLLNADGFWLTNENELLEWNFMFEDRKGVNFQNDNLDEWSEIARGSGQIITLNGLYTFETVDLDNNVDAHNHEGGQDALIQSGGQWHVVSKVPRSGALADYFVDRTWSLMWDVLRKNSLYFLLILVISLLLAFSLYVNRRTYARIKYYSEYDALTKAFNRRAGLAHLNELIPTDERRHFLISLCFLDVNGLKQVNDILGHQYGDELIKTVVEVINRTIRDQDFVVRMGGDEFLIVLNGIDIEDAEKVWERIREAYDTINKTEDRPYIVSVSHGIVSHKTQQKSQIDDLIKLADEKMYQEKSVIKANLKVLKDEKK